MAKKKSEWLYDVCIIGGAGHVGLPLGVSSAIAGFRTVLFDINKKSVATITKGKFPFKEEDGDSTLQKALKSKNLTATGSASVISQSRIIILIVGTPVDEYLNPKFDVLDKIVERYTPHLRDGQILMLRSTIFPGTSERLQKYFKKKKLKVQIAFCPERVAEGYAIREIQTFPQIVSAFDQETLKEVKSFFTKLSKGGAIVATPIEAELAKLYTNSWRYISFAVANQFYMMATDSGADYERIYRIMTENYPRTKALPRPGFAAGPCLFKDTMQLAAFNQNRFFLGHSAMLINEGMPRFLINHIKHTLCSDNLHEKTIGILGMTFKADSDDTRDSLSFKLRKMARLEAKEVYAHDSHLKDPSLSSLDTLLRKSDIIILATPHEEYAKIPVSKLKDKIIVDIWNHLPQSKMSIEI
jgi:UDP-N-acetyl-D-mannosaminuronic acid dehydrogenase